jgi:hypothetical protein
VAKTNTIWDVKLVQVYVKLDRIIMDPTGIFGRIFKVAPKSDVVF